MSYFRSNVTNFRQYDTSPSQGSSSIHYSIYNSPAAEESNYFSFEPSMSSIKSQGRFKSSKSPKKSPLNPTSYHGNLMFTECDKNDVRSKFYSNRFKSDSMHDTQENNRIPQSVLRMKQFQNTIENNNLDASNFSNSLSSNSTTSSNKSGNNSPIMFEENQSNSHNPPNMHFTKENGAYKCTRPTSYHQRFSTMISANIEYKDDYKPTEFTKKSDQKPQNDQNTKFASPFQKENNNETKFNFNTFNSKSNDNIDINALLNNEIDSSQNQNNNQLFYNFMNLNGNSNSNNNNASLFFARQSLQNELTGNTPEIEKNDVNSWNDRMGRDELKTERNEPNNRSSSFFRNDSNSQEKNMDDYRQIITKSKMAIDNLDAKPKLTKLDDDDKSDSLSEILRDIEVPRKNISNSRNVNPIVLKDSNNKEIDLHEKLLKFRQTISLVKKTEEDYIDMFPQENIKQDNKNNNNENNGNTGNGDHSLKENPFDMMSEPSLIFAEPSNSHSDRL